MKRIILSAFLLCVAAVAHGQVNNPSIVVVPSTPSGACTGNLPDKQVATLGTLYSCQNGTIGQIGAGGGSSGFPITIGGASIAASSTTTAIDSLASLQNMKYLSCASELGAQVTAAVTALGAAGGTIVFPNCTTATWTTSVTQVPARINFIGYGSRATQITCSVAGDCLDIHEPVDWGTPGKNFSLAIGSEIAGFTMYGSALTASNQVLIHGEGLNGYTIHDVALNGTDTTHAPTCMEFENTTTDQNFTERDVTYNFQFGANCLTAVLFNQDAGDSNTSFGYNQFEFSIAVASFANGLVFNGSGVLYGGSLIVLGNHGGPGGAMLQFNNAFTTGALGPSEKIFVAVEENGSGAGTVLSATGSGVLRFEGSILNGAGGAPALATTVGGSNAANVIFLLSSPNNNLQVATGGLNIPGGALTVGASGFNPAANIVTFTGNWPFGTNFLLSNTSSGGAPWNIISEGSGEFAGALHLNNGTNVPLTLGSNLAIVPGNGDIAWSQTSNTAPSTAQNVGLTSPATATLSCDTSTAANGICLFKLARVAHGVIYSAAGTAIPSCVAGLNGQEAVVSDATTPTFLATYASGGGVVSPVMCNGSNWVTY